MKTNEMNLQTPAQVTGFLVFCAFLGLGVSVYAAIVFYAIRGLFGSK